MVICDFGNNIGVVEYADFGVTMVHPVPAVEAIFDIITKNADNFGVAHAINHYLFNE